MFKLYEIHTCSWGNVFRKLLEFNFFLLILWSLTLQKTENKEKVKLFNIKGIIMFSVRKSGYSFVDLVAGTG